MLILCGLLMAVAGLTFALTSNLIVLLLVGLTGVVSVTSGEVGAFLAVEQAVLAQIVPAQQRTQVFSLYNFSGYAAAALGALASGLPTLLADTFTPETTSRSLFALYGLIGGFNALLYARLSPAAEVVPSSVLVGKLGLGPSRSVVFKLAALQSMDAFAGGLVVQSLLALWLYQRYGVEAASLALLFFAAQLCSAASLLAATLVARRIGLLNTMVFTHLPSNLLLMLIPLMPNFALAAIVLLLRQCLSQMDVPTRQAYTMAMVTPAERSAAAGLTGVARTAATALSPAVAGILSSNLLLGLPFLVCGLLKSGYDAALYYTFRQVPMPEEQDKAD